MIITRDFITMSVWGRNGDHQDVEYLFSRHLAAAFLADAKERLYRYMWN